MGKDTGFLEFDKESPPLRPVDERVRDFQEYGTFLSEENLQRQASRCMDCGVPFCHMGCPLGNMIPDWNDLVYRGRWKEALAALHSTNNFPEFTGRICPAPCEDTCVLNEHYTLDTAEKQQKVNVVTIEEIEKHIAERGWAEGWIQPQLPEKLTGKRIAVVGSGPAGLAAAQQLRRAGHDVTVFEKDNRIGGLLVYGIPDFKLDKKVVTRRVKQIRAKVKGEVLDEESEDEYSDDDFDMPAGFGFADDVAKRPGTMKPKVRETGRPGTTIGRGRGGNEAPRGEDGFHPDEHYGDDGFDDDSDYNEDGFDADELRAYHKHNEDAGLEPSTRARTPLRPVTPLEEPIIGHYGDPGLDTPYTVGRFPLVTSDALTAASLTSITVWTDFLRGS